eukprot:8359747-Alexandrium_andersonii.AAC.1
MAAQLAVPVFTCAACNVHVSPGATRNIAQSCLALGNMRAQNVPSPDRHPCCAHGVLLATQRCVVSLVLVLTQTCVQ